MKLNGKLAAKIAVSAATYAIDRPYTYLIGEALADEVRPGVRVIVPFGAGNRPTEGIVLATERDPEDQGYALKLISSVLDERPVLDEEGIRLALWMRERLFCTVYDAVRVMLPAGLYYALKNHCVLTEGMDKETAYAAAKGRPSVEKLLDILYANGGKIEMEDLHAAFGENTSPVRPLALLKKEGIVSVEALGDRNVSDKTERYASLAVSPEEAFRMVEGQRKRYPVRYTVVEWLSRMERIPAKELCYFTGATNAVLKTMEKRGILQFEKLEVYRTPAYEEAQPELPPVLTEEQQAAFDGIRALAESGKPACSLLYGVTGSGKTSVYVSLIHDCLAGGKDALMLVPEIALTPQTVHRFRSQFGSQVAVLHSMLSAGARYDEWKRIRDGQARVVVGTRSAVFAPVKNLGLIIIDEEQEYSYKSENTPRYHARDIAKYRAVQNGAQLVLGSATPSVESMFLAKSGKYHLFELRKRYNQNPLPKVLTVDLKQELRSGNPGSITGELEAELKKTISRGEQSILFLNRRGSYKMVVCSQCGEAPVCDRCSVHMTYHRDNGRLMCHYCGRSKRLPSVCPLCGGRLSFTGCGTQELEDELNRKFPGVEVLRMDADTISASNTHEKLLKKFAEKKIPILVGTQMVAKGLDFANVTLVGVINADQSLYTEDFRASERTFSLVTQVVGRAGRGSREGRAVIQTCAPNNDVLRQAAQQDYDSFYQEEILMRQLRGFPPFLEYYRISFSGEDEGAVLRAAMRLRDGAMQWINLPGYQEKKISVLGPVAAGIVRVNNRYRYYLNVYGISSPQLRRMLSELMTAAAQDKLNAGVSVSVDWNPLD